MPGSGTSAVVLHEGRAGAGQQRSGAGLRPGHRRGGGVPLGGATVRTAPERHAHQQRRLSPGRALPLGPAHAHSRRRFCGRGLCANGLHSRYRRAGQRSAGGLQRGGRTPGCAVPGRGGAGGLAPGCVLWRRRRQRQRGGRHAGDRPRRPAVPFCANHPLHLLRSGGVRRGGQHPLHRSRPRG